MAIVLLSYLIFPENEKNRKKYKFCFCKFIEWLFLRLLFTFQVWSVAWIQRGKSRRIWKLSLASIDVTAQEESKQLGAVPAVFKQVRRCSNSSRGFLNPLLVCAGVRPFTGALHSCWVPLHARTSTEGTQQGETSPGDFMAWSQKEPLQPIKTSLFQYNERASMYFKILYCHQQNPAHWTEIVTHLGTEFEWSLSVIQGWCRGGDAVPCVECLNTSCA